MPRGLGAWSDVVLPKCVQDLVTGIVTFESLDSLSNFAAVRIDAIEAGNDPPLYTLSGKWADRV
jgi:hypothetical protein